MKPRWIPGFLLLVAWGSAGCESLADLNPLPAVRSPVVEPPPAPIDIPRVRNTFALELISKRQASGVTARIFNTGKVFTRGEVVSSLKSWHAKIALDIPVVLMRHPKEGLILFETGLSPDESRRPKEGELMAMVNPSDFRFEIAKGQDIVSQLEKSGMNPSEVRWVVISHLHEDTAGMMDAFPEANVVISSKEWEWAKSRADEHGHGMMDWGMLQSKIKLKVVDLSTAPAFGAFEHGVDLFMDGSIFLVSLPGHTPGNIGLWANLDGGPVLLTGGACLVVDNYLDLALPAASQMDDVAQYWRTLHEIRAMRDGVPRLIVLPGHDLAPITISDRSDLPVVPFYSNMP